MAEMKQYVLLTVLLVVSVLPSIYPQPSQQLVPEVLFANFESGVLVLGGFVGSGRQTFPLLGIASDSISAAYFLKIRGYLLNSVAHGDTFFYVGTAYVNGLPAILLVQLRMGEEPRVKVIHSDLPLYGMDLLLINNTLYITGYFYRYTPVVESDIILIKYNYTAGRVEGSLVLGSAAFDDYPKKILSDGNSIIVVGDTYAYNVSQSDVLIARVKPDLKLVWDVAVGGAGREFVEDAVLMEDGSLLIVGSTVGGTGTPDAFVVKVSDIGGLTYLSAAIGYGSEYAASVLKLKDSYVAALYGSFEEDRSLTLLVNYTSRDPWTLGLRAVLAVNSSAGHVVPLRSRGTAITVKVGDCIAVLNPQERAVCLRERAEPLAVNLLDFGEQALKLFQGLYGWKPLWSVMRVRESPSLRASDMQLQVEEMPLSEAELQIGKQRYISRVNPVREAIKFIEKNMPLLLFIPMIAAATLLAFEIRRRGW